MKANRQKLNKVKDVVEVKSKHKSEQLWYVVGSNDKGESSIGKFSTRSRIEAVRQADKWIKRNGLKKDYFGMFNN